MPHMQPGLGSPVPYLHREWAHPAHICAGSALDICTGTELTRATSAPGLGSPPGASAPGLGSAGAGQPRARALRCRRSKRPLKSSRSTSARNTLQSGCKSGETCVAWRGVCVCVCVHACVRACVAHTRASRALVRRAHSCAPACPAVLRRGRSVPFAPPLPSRLRSGRRTV
jgi:hypothetical protein